uniref:Col_cuticle_N domain-containing protein n=1 Tax=Macrostomum lignano TaxID=282301 RepID=A0A1I8GQF4_9PLAT
ALVVCVAAIAFGVILGLLVLPAVLKLHGDRKRDTLEQTESDASNQSMCVMANRDSLQLVDDGPFFNVYTDQQQPLNSTTQAPRTITPPPLSSPRLSTNSVGPLKEPRKQSVGAASRGQQKQPQEEQKQQQKKLPQEQPQPTLKASTRASQRRSSPVSGSSIR